MRDISNSTGSDSDSEAWWEDGDITDPSSREAVIKSVIQQANSIPLKNIFKHYNLKLDEYNRKITCPLPAHKGKSGGRERSASFWFYPETNTFWCFGCKAGNKPVNLVAEMDNLSKLDAAYKILTIFGHTSSIDIEQQTDSYADKIKILIEFSSIVREFRSFFDDNQSFEFIENICKAFDTINSKHNLSTEALKSVVDKLKIKIESYK